MAGEDKIELLDYAIVAILDTAPAIVALTGRPSQNVLPWHRVTAEAVPCLAFEVISVPPYPGEYGTVQPLYQFTAVAAGPNARRTVHRLLGAVETLLTEPALRDEGLDACPMPGRPPSRGPMRSEAVAGTDAVPAQDLDFALLYTP
jgi:hypothetical protein